MSRAAAKLSLGLLLAFAGAPSAFASCSGQFSAGYFCGIQPGGSAGIPGPVQLTPSSLQPIASHTVLSNVTGGSAAPSANSPSSILDLFSSTQGAILYRDVSGWQALAPGTNGQVLTSGGAAANPSWGSIIASVSSVGLSMPGIFTVSGSPVTTTGTLTATLNNQSANIVWAGPSTGAPSAPTFRSLVGADLPNPSSSTLGGVQSVAAQTSKWINSISTLGVPSLTQPAFTDISGQINTSQLPTAGNNTIIANISGVSSQPVPNTLSSIIDSAISNTQGVILYRNASAWVALPTGTNGQVLTTGGAAANPAWTTVTGTGTVTSVATGTGLTGGAITTTGTISFASIADQRILANTSGSSNPPVATQMTTLLDIIGSTQGQVLYRGASNWAALSAGTNGQFLQTTGAGSSPQWATMSINGVAGAVTLLTEAQGRLTGVANTPVMTTTQASITTLRYDCYTGAQVPYYDGTQDRIDTISSCEVTDAMVSAASAGQVVSGQVYDVWWVHGGANRICLAMSSSSGGGGGWASDTGGSNTARGTGYSQLDRTTRPYTTNKNAISNCFNGATNYGSVSANQATYLGTIYASGNGATTWTYGAVASGGTAGLFGIWNMYNRVNVGTQVSDSSVNWTYNTAAWRAANNSSTMRVSFVFGLNEDGVSAVYNAEGSSVGSAAPGVGLDTTGGFNSTQGFIANIGANQSIAAIFDGQAGSGFHFLSANEFGGTSTTFQGTGSAPQVQTGLNVRLRM